MADNIDDIIEEKETVTTVESSIGPDEGKDLDLDLSTITPAEELDKEEKKSLKKIEKNPDLPSDDVKAKDILPDWMKEELEEDKANLLGNKYADYKDVFASVSAEINKKTIQLLATKHMDHLDLSDDGVVTNKQGEVVETKEDFIKATGFGDGDIIYNNASKQFDSEELNYAKERIQLADDAWLYLTSSLESESGNNIYSLFGIGEEQTLDFKQFEEQVKVEVLNQLSDDQFYKSMIEGNIMKKGVTGFKPNETDAALKKFGTAWTVSKWERIETWNRVFKDMASTAISLEDKEMLLTNAKATVLGNQLKIQYAAFENLSTLKDNLETEESKLNDNFNDYKNLSERTQDDITKLNKKYGAYTYNKKGDIYFESYGILPTPEDAAEQQRINVALKKLGIDKLTLGKQRLEVLELFETYNDGVKDYTSTKEELFNLFLYDDVNEKFN